MEKNQFVRIRSKLIVTKCSPSTSQVEAKITKCGPQPIIHNTMSLSKDGFTILPQIECLWSKGIVNLNDDLYEYQNGNWSKIETNMHSSTINLVNNFNEILDFEFEYIPKVHPIHKDADVAEITSFLQYISHSLPNSKHVPLLQSKNLTNLLKLPHIPQMSSINIMLIVLLIL